MSTTKTARMFLGLNTGFSILCSVILFLFPDYFAELMFVAPAAWVPLALRILAAGLLLFALTLIMLVANPYVTRAEVMLIVIMDIGWIAASAAFVVFGQDLLTFNGILVIDVVALFVGAFAIGQFLGARKIVPPLSRASLTSREGLITASVRRLANASPETVWKVMNDHPGYADVANNLSKVEVVSGDGMGMLRRCYGPKGENWTETCDTFEDGKFYGFKVHTDAADYPYPIKDLTGRWSVIPGENGTEFAIEISAVPKGNYFTKLLFTVATRLTFRKVLIDLADKWSERMEREAKL